MYRSLTTVADSDGLPGDGLLLSNILDSDGEILTTEWGLWVRVAVNGSKLKLQKFADA